MATTLPPTYLYKIVHSSAPPPSPLPERLPLSQLDAADGFIHLSTSTQVPRTLVRFFRDDTQVYLLRLTYSHVEAHIRWENPQGTAPGRMGDDNTFGHLYNGGRLGRDEVESIKVVNRDKATGWAEALEAVQDWLVY
ncbi:hypothetical protein AX16_000161 [Volvariella volvacea WC 439]|nr:hypothetical protein AX16_000161 [Volvariella volvacea WC 439]